MHEIHPDRPIDATLHAILLRAHAATALLGIGMFVGGAMARDILLSHVHGMPARRATRDVDIGLFIESWDRFDALKRQLIASAAFFPVEGAPHRLHYARPGGIALDLIPFGGVAGPGPSIAWPPGHDVILNVAGFEEALACAQQVDLGQGLGLPVCSLASLSTLKLLAWLDRRFDNNKDAVDFLTLASSYGMAGNVDRIYEEAAGFLDAAHHDPDLAGAALLGMDAAKQCQPPTWQKVASILEDGHLMQQMQDQLLRVKGVGVDEGDAERVAGFIAFYRQGFSGRLAP